MISRNKTKFILNLHKSKFRTKNKLFIVEGQKLVEELIRFWPDRVYEIYALESWIQKNSHLLKGFNHLELTEDELRKISLQNSPNQVLAIVQMPEQVVFYADLIKDAELVLVLDTIQDPGNLGTIIRTADWFGIKTLVASTDTADVFNPKVIQSSMGSVFRVKVFYTDLEKALNDIKMQDNHVILASVLGGKNIFDFKRDNRKKVLVMGNESKGISEELQLLADEKMTIPRAGDSSVESLNVAIASAILISQLISLK